MDLFVRLQELKFSLHYSIFRTKSRMIDEIIYAHQVS